MKAPLSCWVIPVGMVSFDNSGEIWVDGCGCGDVDYIGCSDGGCGGGGGDDNDDSGGGGCCGCCSYCLLSHIR